jgi:hypothetical protein
MQIKLMERRQGNMLTSPKNILFFKTQNNALKVRMNKIAFSNLCI